MQVEFTREVEEDDKSKSLKHNKRILFQRMAPYPQRKVITFNRYTDDFEFYVNYGDLSFLNQDDLRWVKAAPEQTAPWWCSVPSLWMALTTSTYFSKPNSSHSLCCAVVHRCECKKWLAVLQLTFNQFCFCLYHQNFWIPESHYREAKGSWGEF